MQYNNNYLPYDETIFFVPKYSQLNIYNTKISSQKILKKKHVSFLDTLTIFEINDKEYYTQFNIKKDMWWSFAELNEIKFKYLAELQFLMAFKLKKGYRLKQPVYRLKQPVN